MLCSKAIFATDCLCQICTTQGRYDGSCAPDQLVHSQTSTLCADRYNASDELRELICAHAPAAIQFCFSPYDDNSIFCCHLCNVVDNRSWLQSNNVQNHVKTLI